MAKAKKAKRTKTAKLSKVTKVRSKSEVFGHLADNAGLTRKQVATVFDGMAGMIRQDLARGPGIFTVPGLMKITVTRKPATKARKGVNPFTGEEIMIKAKPARKVVKVRPLKALKEMV